MSSKVQPLQQESLSENEQIKRLWTLQRNPICNRKSLNAKLMDLPPNSLIHISLVCSPPESQKTKLEYS